MIFNREWEPVTWPQWAGAILILAALSAAVILGTPGFIPVLDHANLLFHEAGHVMAGLFSERFEPYGGTLGQLFFPAVLAATFWRQGRPFPLVLCLFWLFENGFNIAVYMADARALALPLVGGGEHDWNTILGRWNLIHLDLRLARITRGAAWAGLLLAIGWLSWRAWQDRSARQGQSGA